MHPASTYRTYQRGVALYAGRTVDGDQIVYGLDGHGRYVSIHVFVVYHSQINSFFKITFAASSDSMNVSTHIDYYWTHR